MEQDFVEDMEQDFVEDLVPVWVGKEGERVWLSKWEKVGCTFVNKKEMHAYGQALAFYVPFEGSFYHLSKICLVT